ncbi:MAG: carboxypeptidase-like regulatory domain-containing protein [Gemmatimonadota bacterium]|nr:carboxypeptidase-like regulatory domain-containing protein [Gemmatimonadota bacterium]
MKSVFALFVFALVAPRLAAQDARPTDVLAGRVTDLGGRPVAEAQIEALSLGSNVVRTQLTDSAGRYRISFSEHAPRYQITARRMGFSPVQRTITRGSTTNELFIADLQFTGSPVALSMVEVTGDAYARAEGDAADPSGGATVPNPVAEILARKDSLHLSAIQIVALTDIADSLHAQNSTLFRRIQTLITRQKENGDPADLAGSVSLMLQQAATNSDRAVTAAEKLLRAEQWRLIPKGITARFESTGDPTP